LSYLLLVLVILLAASAQLLAKRGAGQLDAKGPVAFVRAVLSNPYLLGGMACAFASPLVYILALREIPLSVAFPITSLTSVVVVAGGVLFYRERVTVTHWLGVALIVVGVALVGAA
jgi:drug/metabolite transporter (DMT)-like permease